MHKKWFMLFLFFCCSSTLAKTKCNSQVNYDIYIFNNNIKILSESKAYTITFNGNIFVDNNLQQTSTNTKDKIIELHNLIQKIVPEIEEKTYWHLEDLRNHFNAAIVKNIGTKSSLLKHLDNIYNNLKTLMQKAINTQDGVIVFHHTNFNRITDDGEKVVKKEFVGVLKDSILEFKLFKNFSTLKGIARNEWKKKKNDLKTFNEEVCNDMQKINASGFPFGL